MARYISFFVLVAFILIFAALFFQVVSPFLLPLFLAGVLALLFRPWYERVSQRVRGRPRLAAGITTGLVVLVVLIPLATVLGMATVQLVRLAPQALLKAPAPPDAAAPQHSLPTAPTPAHSQEAAPHPAVSEPSVPSGDDDARRTAPDEVSGAAREGQQRPAGELGQWREALIERVQRVVPIQGEQIDQALRSAIEALAVRTLRLIRDLAAFVVGLLITIVALYYFFIDGPRLLQTLQRLTPLDDRHERELMHQFDTVCRAVVFATLTSAVVQGTLAGIAFLIVGLSAQVFLLSILTTLFAMIPLVGTFVVWGPVALVLAWNGQWWQAIFLAVYGTGCISTVDNLIKPHILHGRAKLHPLLALLSVLGGVQALGLWGIFVGPMVVAFLYALLNILHQELKAFAEADQPRRNAPPEPQQPAPSNAIKLAHKTDGGTDEPAPSSEAEAIEKSP